jgi:hypothetical protein
MKGFASDADCAYCKRRYTALSTAMARKRAKASTLVALVDEIVETFETGSTAFGIALIELLHLAFCVSNKGFPLGVRHT